MSSVQPPSSNIRSIIGLIAISVIIFLNADRLMGIYYLFTFSA